MVERRDTRGSALTRERIIEAALALIDDEGLEKLTMRSLGSKLGVDAMMIYRHFASKAVLLDGVMEEIWRSVRIDDVGATTGWREQLVAVMHRLREAFIAHPHAVVIIGTRPASGPGLFLLFERLLGALVAAGLTIDRNTADLLNALVNYTVGHVLAEVGQPVGGEADERSQLTISSAAFPHLAIVFNGDWEYDPVRQFDRALRAMVASQVSAEGDLA